MLLTIDHILGTKATYILQQFYFLTFTLVKHLFMCTRGMYRIFIEAYFPLI